MEPILQKGAYSRDELLAEVRNLIAAARGGDDHGGTMATILLVEDNEMNRDMLSRRLRRKGYEVLIAVDGQAGVEWRRRRCRP